MVDVPLPQDVLERIGRRASGRSLVAGVRPEDFEDATKVDRDTRPRGTTFQTRLGLVEAMGAEFYAHFAVTASRLRSDDMRDLLEDAGGVERATDEDGGTAVVARLSPESSARTGEPAELWLDATKLHFFDAESGEALTYRQ